MLKRGKKKKQWLMMPNCSGLMMFSLLSSSLFLGSILVFGVILPHGNIAYAGMSFLPLTPSKQNRVNEVSLHS
jgi:hypothetical protein